MHGATFIFSKNDACQWEEMDSPNKNRTGTRIRTRSSRDSSVDDLTEDIPVKAFPSRIANVNSARVVLTRHDIPRSVVARSVVDLENEKNFGLEFPMGRRKRKFPKILHSLDSPLSYIEASHKLGLSVDLSTNAAGNEPVEEGHVSNEKLCEPVVIVKEEQHEPPNGEVQVDVEEKKLVDKHDSPNHRISADIEESKVASPKNEVHEDVEEKKVLDKHDPPNHKICVGIEDRKPAEKLIAPNAKAHMKNGNRKKSIVKQNAVFKRRAFGQRRRKRIRAFSCSESGTASTEPVKIATKIRVIESTNKSTDSKPTLGEDESLLQADSDLNVNDSLCKKPEEIKAKPRDDPERSNLPNVNGHGDSLPKFGSDDDVLQQQKRVNSGNLSLQRTNCQDNGMESDNDNPCTEELSVSGVASNDEDSRGSTELESRTKDRVSVHGIDSDDGSIATTDSRSSSSRHRRKSDQSRPGIDFRVGGRLEARDYLNMWYPSRIIQVDWDDKEVLIHFERWNSRFDEWVSMDSPRLRAITRTSSRKEKAECPFPVAKVGWANLVRPYNTYRGIVKSLKNEYKVGEVVLAKWTDCKMYPAKISKINPDLSYNVMFYDGFERLVQYINIKKLPPDFSGDLSFRSAPPMPVVPPKSDEKRRRSTSGSKKEVDAKCDANMKPQKNKILPDKDSPSVEKLKPKPSNLSSGLNHKSNSPAVPNKRMKLLVGGIFQAKRHQLEVKTSGNLSRHGESKTPTPEKTKVEIKTPKSNKKIDLVAGEKTSEKVMDVPVVAITPSLPDPIKGNAILTDGMLVAPKAFIIEEDHNHFKCLVEGCGKAFRKDVLLSSHMKHYHTVKRKSNVNHRIVEKKPDPVEQPPNVEQPSEQVTQPTKNEGNLERKLITEKRRQLLFQKQLDKQHKAAAAAASLPKPPVKKILVPAEANEENIENIAIRSKSRKRRFLLTARNVNTKFKRRKLEGDEKPKSLDYSMEPLKSSTDVLEPENKPISEPISSKMFLKLKRKQRTESILSSDESEKSTTTSSCDSTETLEDKALMEKLGKEFCVYRSGQNAVNPAWGGNSELRDEVVNCRCLMQEEDGLMMQCEVCLAWQHGACFNIEDEDKVPEKYVCFACENPLGQRRSFRYKHNQDWFKLGELATFRFLPKRDSWSLKENMLKTHNLASQLLSIESVLHSLQYKLQMVQKPKHSNLILWSQPWQGSPSYSNNSRNRPNKKSIQHLRNLESGQNGGWAFPDHSYSVPSRDYRQQSELADQPITFLADPCDDKNLCFEVAANEVLDSQGLGPPIQDEASEVDITVNTSKTTDEGPGKTKPLDCGLDEGKGRAMIVPKEELILDNRIEVANDELAPNVRDPSSTTVNNANSKDYNIKPATVNKLKLKDCSFNPQNSKKPIAEAIDVYTCQLNLLGHIEHLQEELDRRLDELNQQLEFLESDFESPSLSSSGDTLADIPRVKRLLKSMGTDLLKVQRMALYC